MNLLASSVGSTSQAMALPNRNTVLRPVMVFPGERSHNMNEDLRVRLTRYRIAMSLAAEMLEKGIISEQEYAKIDTIMAKKHGVSLSTIFR